ncbi:peptidase [Micrococcus flavus]|nr:site-2 protease family protein [Micrococcus flavus]TFI04130.1 peptidase [Micrococcus flavus]GGK39189.1 peptidase [Micrococcus flavus]
MSATRGIRLGRVAGAPVVLTPAWALVAAFVVLAFGPQVERALPRLGAGAWLVAGAYAVLLALSVLVHEIAHAVVGRAFGQRPHEIVLTLWGGHTQFRGAHAGPGGSVATALAGPAANLVLAALAWGAGEALDARGVTGLLLDVTVWANLLLAAFNALPGAPLDGGRMVESAVWAATGSRDRGVAAAGWAGRAVAVGLVLAVLVGPLLRGERPDLVMTVLLVWVALTLWRGASEAVERGRWGRRLERVRLDALRLPAVPVPLTASVAEALAAGGASAARVAVDDAGRPRGVVDLTAVQALDPAAAAATPVTAVCRAVGPEAVLDADALPAAGGDLVAALAALDGRPGGSALTETPVWVLTDAHGTVRGVLPRETLLTALTDARPTDPQEHRA